MKALSCQIRICLAVIFPLVALSVGGALSQPPAAPTVPFADTGQLLGQAHVHNEVCGDLDGDGLPDCVLASYALGANNQVFRNQGGGILKSTADFLPVRSDPNPLWNFGLALADVNRDGHLDLVSADAWRGVNVYLNDGSGHLTKGHQTLYSTDMGEIKGVALGDFNDDGALDFVVGGHIWEPDRVYFNDGTGTFYDSGQRLGLNQTWKVAVGDLNGDGYLDYVAASRYGHPLRVYFNDGHGRFTDSGQALGMFDANDVKLVDVNGDGALDIIVAATLDTSTGKQNRIFLNDGHGSFADSGQNLGSLDCAAFEIGVGDLDNDGDIDLILGNRNHGSEIYLNDGLGHFTRMDWTLESLKTGEVPGSGDVGVYLVDLNNAGYLDIIIGESNLDVITGESDKYGYKIYRNTGALGRPNTSPSPPVSLASATSGRTVTLNWNDGGDAETPKALLTYNLRVGRTRGGNEVFSGALQVGFGNMGHAFRKIIQRLAAGTYYWSVQTVDTGYRRSVWSPEQTFAITLPSDSTPPAPVTLYAAMGQGAGEVRLTWIAPGDDGNVGTADRYLLRSASSAMTEDNWPSADALLAAPAPSSAGTWENITISGLTPGQRYYFALKTADASGNLSQLSNSPSALAGISVPLYVRTTTWFGTFSTERVAFADLNGDGHVDLVQGNGGELAESLVVYLNDGHGRFTASSQVFPATQLHDIALGDVDGDGKLDLVISGTPQGTTIWLNDGSGRFTAGQNVSGNVGAVRLADVDGDGDLDLLLGSTGTRVWINDGHGRFVDSGQVLGTESSRSLAVGDVNGDGDVDLVQGNANGNRVFLNDGAGHFSDSGQVLGTSNTYDVRLADINGDGILDLIAGNSNNAVDEVYSNDGHGRFTLFQKLGKSGEETKGLAVGDLDNNGYPGVVEAAWNGGATVSINYGNGMLLPSGTPLGPDRTNFVALADVDEDGALDLLAAVKGSPNVLFLNSIGRYAPNSPPLPPASLKGSVDGTTVKLSWVTGSDAETPKTLLTYNLRVGKTPGGNEVLSGALPVGPGNAGQTLNRTLRNLPPGSYYWSAQTVDGGFRASAWAGEQTVAVGLKPPNTVVSAASFLAGPLAPGAIGTLFGSNLASGEVWPDANPNALPTQLGFTSLMVNGVPAPLYYVGPTQINFQVPFELQQGTASAVVKAGDSLSDPAAFSIGKTAPQIFVWGQNRAVAQNYPAYELNDPNHPAATGAYVIVYLTGQGQLDNPVRTGSPAPISPLSRPLAAVSATIGGASTRVLDCALSPGYVGLLQCALEVPKLSSGEYPVVITTGGVASNAPLVSISAH
jgi:uncharacterized protein (TIGR03437 family)